MVLGLSDALAAVLSSDNRPYFMVGTILGDLEQTWLGDGAAAQMFDDFKL